MEVIRARTAGFCMGVSLALQNLDKAVIEYANVLEPGFKAPSGSGSVAEATASRRIVTYGPIIHNPQVLARYEALGVVCTESLDGILDDDIVIIRAHGIPRHDEARLQGRGLLIRDATCPKVKQAQLAIGEATAQGQTLLLFGESEHPEVAGLISYAGGAVHVFDTLDALAELPLASGSAYVLAAQTTQDQVEFARISDWVRERFGDMPILRTICNATSKRQDEALSIAGQVDFMVVVGGKTSGNTRRLAALSRECGVRTWHVESPEELPADMLRQGRRIGLTAGASTPKGQIDATQMFLEKLA